MDLINRAANIPNIARSADSRVPSDLSHKVIICHPGYGDAADDLISFAAFDRLHGGLYYDTALIACGIISGNHWDGFFSKDIDGEKIISFASCDGILSPGSYYFQLPGLCGLSKVHQRCRNHANRKASQASHSLWCRPFVNGNSHIGISLLPGPLPPTLPAHSQFLRVLDQISRCSFSSATMANAGWAITRRGVRRPICVRERRINGFISRGWTAT